MTIKNPTLRRRTKGLSECAEDVRESRLLGYELKDVGNLIVTMTTHMTDLQNKVDSQAEHIKTLNKKLEQTPADIVRCKDCKHSDKFGCHNPIWGDGWANYPSPSTKDTDFCSYGDREGEEIQGLKYAENVLASILREQEEDEK